VKQSSFSQTLGQTQRTTVSPQGQRHSRALPCCNRSSPSLPLLSRSRQGCGTHHHQTQGLLCIWILSVPMGHNDYSHCSISPVLPCCQSIHHPREYPSYGLGGGGGCCCCSSALLLCFVLRVQLPETQSHKTQFTIPAAFWHPSVLAYR